MRDMAHIVVLFAIVIAFSIVAIGVINITLGIHHTDTHGAAASATMVVLHHLPYCIFSGGLVALHRHIFGR